MYYFARMMDLTFEASYFMYLNHSLYAGNQGSGSTVDLNEYDKYGCEKNNYIG